MNEEDAACLSQLLKALGAGARAVQALPLSSSETTSTFNKNSSSSKSDAVDRTRTTGTTTTAEDDDFAFESSFPEFAAALSQAQETERKVLIEMLQEIASQTTVLDFEEWDSSTPGAVGTSAAELFELSATACELLLEQVELYLSSSAAASTTKNNANTASKTKRQLRTWSQTAREKSQTAWSTILQNIVEMEKPQIRYSMAKPCNGRTQVFWPAVHPDKPFGSTTSSSSSLIVREGHGYDTSHGTLLRHAHGQFPAFNDDDNDKEPLFAAPKQHAAHYYETEIESFAPTEWELEPLLEAPPSQPPSLDTSTTKGAESSSAATWIDTPAALDDLGRRLSELTAAASSSQPLKMMALDLEAHSYRSFAGMVCLMQLTLVMEDENYLSVGGGSGDGGSVMGSETRQAKPVYFLPSSSTTLVLENYLIDTLKLSATSLNRVLQGPLGNPKIVKLLHGADSDIGWLQRDFGLYIVHLWDTGRAARQLKFASASYAYLLQRYCLYNNDDGDNTKSRAGKSADSGMATTAAATTTTELVASIVQGKQGFQLSDWRQRPLSLAMQHYAISDTHFLVHVAYHLKWELQQQRPSTFSPNRMLEVLDVSRQVSLIRYPGPPLFRPKGYQKLLLTAGRGGRRNRRNSKERGATSSSLPDVSCTPLQEFVLRALWDWRDATAREMDESIAYICPNATLLRWAMSSMTVSSLSSNAIPSNLRLPNSELEPVLLLVVEKAVQSFGATKENASGQKIERIEHGESSNSGDATRNCEDEVVGDANVDDDDDDAMDGLDEDELDEYDDEVGGHEEDEVYDGVGLDGAGKVPSKSSAFFKPSIDDAKRRGMMSPVLGTEALYKQAGWMTPQEETGPVAAASLAREAKAISRSTSLGGGGGGALRTSTSVSNVEEDEEEEEDDEEEEEVEEIHTTASEGDHDPRRMVLSIDTSVSSPTAALDFKTGVAATPGASGSASRRGRSRGEGAATTTTSSQNPSTTTTTADGFASALAAREASKSPVVVGNRSSTSLSLEDDVNAARQSSAQIRSELLESHHKNVLGLLSAATAVAGGYEEDDPDEEEEDEEDETDGAGPNSSKVEVDATTKPVHPQQHQDKTAAASGTSTTAAATTGTTEEEFSIPRSMREIYKISNRNRRHKKTGSPTPLAERGCTLPPSNEKELAELEKAEALLQERGMDAAGFLFTTTASTSDAVIENVGSTSSKKANSNKGGTSENNNSNESNNPTGSSTSSHKNTPTLNSANNSNPKQQGDLSFFRGIGWIPAEVSDDSVTAGCYAQANAVAMMSAGMEEGKPAMARDFAPAAVEHAAPVGPPPPQPPPYPTAPGTTNFAATNAPTAPAVPSPYDYSQMGTLPLQAPLSNNPFFSGAALQGGPLAQSFRAETTGSGSKASATTAPAISSSLVASSRKSNNSSGGVAPIGVRGTNNNVIAGGIGTPSTSGSGNNNNSSQNTNNNNKSRGGRGTTSSGSSTTTERPEKRDGGRSHVYRSSR